MDKNKPKRRIVCNISKDIWDTNNKFVWELPDLIIEVRKYDKNNKDE